MAEAHPDEQRLNDFVYGKLTGSTQNNVVEHLETCARCRELLVALGRERSKEVEAVPVSDPTDPLIGGRLGEYVVLERLSQGGMGKLYRGEQPEIGKRVAIKVLLPEAASTPDLVNRLLSEARAVNAIRHPNIIDIFSFGRLPDGRHYFVMELLEGKSLAELIDSGPVPVETALSILDQAAAALEAAHAVNVIHRDIKPANLFVTPRKDGTLHVTLLDFGIAKQLNVQGETAPNIVLGTPGFMAPEQLKNRPLSGETDVYSLGVVAYALFSGKEPFRGKDTLALVASQLDAEPPRLSVALPDVPRAVENLVYRMMAKKHTDRPSAAEVRTLIVNVKLQAKEVQTLRVQAPLIAIDALRKPRALAVPPVGPEAFEKTHVPMAGMVTQPELKSEVATLDLKPAVPRASATVKNLPAAAFTTIPDRTLDGTPIMGSNAVARATIADVPPPEAPPRRWVGFAIGFGLTLAAGAAWFFLAGR